MQIRHLRPVTRMSAAICGGVFPGYRRACHRARVRATHWLIRATPINIIDAQCSDPENPIARLRRPGEATVARMSEAICGGVFPGYRFAHPGYTAQHH